MADLGAARAFYTAPLPTLGLQLLQDNNIADGTGWLVYGTEPGAPFFVVSCGQPGFWNKAHHAGLAQGGQDNGAPGPRGDGYYAAYVIDPDGNNIEAGYRG